MSQRGNKKKSGRKGSTQLKSDSSPPNETASDVSPTNRPGGDDAPSEDVVREFAESAPDADSEPKPSVPPAYPTVSTPANAIPSLYREVVKTPDEPLSADTMAPADVDAKPSGIETEATLPGTGEEVALVADDSSNFFRSFFSCCVGRK